jgi:hypothetical protein
MRVVATNEEGEAPERTSGRSRLDRGRKEVFLDG